MIARVQVNNKANKWDGSFANMKLWPHYPRGIAYCEIDLLMSAVHKSSKIRQRQKCYLKKNHISDLSSCKFKVMWFFESEKCKPVI